MSVIPLLLASLAVGTTGTVVTGKPAARGQVAPLDFSATPRLDLSKLPATPDGMRIVARVNGRPIPVQRFRIALNRAVKAKGITDATEAEAFRAGVAPAVLDELAKTELVAEYAEKHELRVSDEEVSQALALANEAFPAGQKLEDQAFERGESPEVVRQDIREQLLRNKVQEHIGRAVMPASSETEAELRKRMQQVPHPAQTTSPMEIRARHIVIRSPADAPTSATAAAKARAEQALTAVRGGMDFGQAVRRFSQDRLTRDLDGDLGYFTRGRMFPEFEKAAFELKPGEVSGVVQSPVGFHIIQVTDRREAGIQHVYQEAERRRQFGNWLSETLRQAKVEKYF